MDFVLIPNSRQEVLALCWTSLPVISHKHSSTNAWNQNFNNGNQNNNNKTNTNYVRGVAKRLKELNKIIIGSGEDITFEEVVLAYFSCRVNKRRRRSALSFELNLEVNLRQLYEEIADGSYTIGESNCFVVTEPRVREIWSAGFRDRIVHHLIYNRLSPQWNRSFIADSCACIPGRGTMYGAKRLEHHIRSFTHNWVEQKYYLKCDLANFFVSIDKNILWELMDTKLVEGRIKRLVYQILFNNPVDNCLILSDPSLMNKVPPNKRLMLAEENRGLPIGNLTSQFFANVLLDALDKYVKHELNVKKYVRYVDDCILLGDSPEQLTMWKNLMSEKVLELGLSFNPSKCFIQPIDRGVSFVGQTIYPHRRVPLKVTSDKCFDKADDYNLHCYLSFFRQSQKSFHLCQKLISNIGEQLK